LKPAWEAALGGPLTQPVAAGGRLFLADVDRHTVHAIDAASGKRLWSYAAGGRVDSPPSIYVGRTSGPSTTADGPEVRPTALCIFGSADGYVYCLRADDGALAWRFRAAPVDRRMVAFDQVESVWPVHGSVLVQDGVATLVAGRSMYLDGGLRLCRLDVATGRLLSEKILDDRDPETGENMQRHVGGLNMPVALPDVLSSDGEHLYMRSQVMDLGGNRLGLGPGKGGRDHLFAAYGFTDDSWFHRTYWLFGDSFKGGVGGFGNAQAKPAGRILVNNGTTVFGYGRKPAYFRWASVADYHLFAAPRPGAPRGAPGGERPAASKRGKGKPGVAYLWTCDVPLMARAMVLAGGTLFVAGPADLLDEDAAFQDFSDEAVQKQLALQDAALKGQRGALLLAVDAATGDTLAEYRLDAPPTFDGMIAAGGRVFIATMDGRLIALAEEQPAQ
jgi:outer membrane protein assembly factor BamB